MVAMWPNLHKLNGIFINHGLNKIHGYSLYNKRQFLQSYHHYNTRIVECHPHTRQKKHRSPLKICSSIKLPGLGNVKSVLCGYCSNFSYSSSSHTNKSDERVAEQRKIKQQKKEAKRQERLLRLKSKEQIKPKEKTTAYDLPTQPGEKKDTMIDLPKTYHPSYVEAAWYSWWEREEFFSPNYKNLPESFDGKKRTFVMCLPPPNVTGTLHLGHTLGNAIEDAIIRWHRMSGHETLWNPGCDHAGIATQVVVEKQLMREQGLTRHDLGRDKFVEEVWKWKNSKGSVIYEQMKRLGSSLDWSRAAFTLDPKLSYAVNEAFIRLYQEGLIYRGTRLVNWSCALRSAVSDIEVDNMEIPGPTALTVPGYEDPVTFGLMYAIEYPVEGQDKGVIVATTRPETMLGDTGIAVHPSDPRYTQLHGQFAIHPLTGERLPIICDDFVDRELGTGAVKLTPGHDPIDHEMGVKHQLHVLQVIDDAGGMMNVPETFQGMKRFVARELVIKSLAERGLYHGASHHNMTIPVCSRSQDVIEPLLKEQWFVNCEQMAQQAYQAVKSGQLELIPSQYEKHWYTWLEGIHDWCVSRQLWWGHRVPAYRVTHKHGQSISSEWVCAHNEEEALMEAEKITGTSRHNLLVEQDADVLDTWFSSAIFPFSIFGWPNETTDLNRFYPTSLLETASDIMFFWVARMVMLGQKLTGQLPFKQVLFHSILRDAHGRKMSKSLGNVIDPVHIINGISLQNLQSELSKSNLPKSEVVVAQQGQERDFPLGIPECGADALRFTLCSYNYKEHFTNVNIEHVAHNRRFCNKVWQAFRYCQPHLQDYSPSAQFTLSSHTASATDRWMLSRLAHLVESCDQHFLSYDLHHVTRALHNFWKAEFCDIYLEYSKVALQHGSPEERACVRAILHLCLDTGLRALSPFMPYLTEELFQRLPQSATAQRPPSVCVSCFPHPSHFPFTDPAVEVSMSMVQEFSSELLSMRKDYGLTKKRAHVFVVTQKQEVAGALESHLQTLQTLSRSASVAVSLGNHQAQPEGCIKCKDDENGVIWVQLKGIVDVAEALQQHSARFTAVSADRDKARARLQQGKVPEHVRLMEQEKLAGIESELNRVKNVIASLIQLQQNRQ